MSNTGQDLVCKIDFLTSILNTSIESNDRRTEKIFQELKDMHSKMNAAMEHQSNLHHQQFTMFAQLIAQMHRFPPPSTSAPLQANTTDSDKNSQGSTSSTFSSNIPNPVPESQQNTNGTTFTTNIQTNTAEPTPPTQTEVSEPPKTTSTATEAPTDDTPTEDPSSVAITQTRTTFSLLPELVQTEEVIQPPPSDTVPASPPLNPQQPQDAEIPTEQAEVNIARKYAEAIQEPVENDTESDEPMEPEPIIAEQVVTPEPPTESSLDTSTGELSDPPSNGTHKKQRKSVKRALERLVTSGDELVNKMLEDVKNQKTRKRVPPKRLQPEHPRQRRSSKKVVNVKNRFQSKSHVDMMNMNAATYAFRTWPRQDGTDPDPVSDEGICLPLHFTH